MKLTYVMNMRMPTEKAHGVQVMRMCEAFAHQGMQVRLFASNRRTSIKDEPFGYYGVQPVFRISSLFSLDTVRYGKLGFYLQSATFLISAFFALLLTRPDIVYTRDPWVAVIARMCGIHFIGWEIHTAQPAWICRLGARAATAIIPISSGLKEHLLQAGVPEEKIQIEHDGADLEEFKDLPSRDVVRTMLALPPEPIIIGYIGKLSTMGESKGVESIIAAVGQLKRDIPSVFLLIVGINSDEQASVERLVRAAGLGEKDARLVLHVPRARIPAYLRAASVLAMNYPDTPHFARMMSPLKLFEYMASGTPIVTSDIPSIREVLDDTSAFFVAPDMPERLYEGIHSAITDHAEAHVRATRAQQLVEQYTWEARASRILQTLGVSRLQAHDTQVDSNDHG